MATYKLGKVFSLTFNDILVVCKTSATLDLTNEGITVFNDCTDDYGAQVPGGNKSGSLSFEADLDFDANGISSMSWFDLVPLLGTVAEATFGESSTEGERYVTFEGRLDNLSLTAATNERINFTGTLNLSGAPEILTVTT